MNIGILGKGVAYSTASYMLLGVFMAIFVVIEKQSFTESLVSLFVSSLFLWCTLGVIFGFLGSVVIGIPIAAILIKLKAFNPVVFLITGGVVGYVLGGLSWIMSDPNLYIKLMFLIYGAVGALAFWYGVSSNTALKQDLAENARPFS